MSQQPSGGQPGRHQTSFPAMVGAMLVTVGLVLAFVLWRGIFRDDVDTSPEPVDWQESVSLAQSAGLSVAHPRELPSGWVATSVDLRAGDDPQWGLGVVTEDGDFVGIRQRNRSVGELVRLHVDKAAVQGKDVTVQSEVATVWQTWSDSGGDHGFSTELGDEALLVYGSAPVDELEDYLGLLTQD